MKEDYLWDKSGDDAEITALENSLAAFRYQEMTPPALPQKVFTLEKRPRRSFFRLAFGFAAFASVLAVLSLLWFQLSGSSSSKTPVAETVGETNVVNRAQKTADTSFVAPRETVEPRETVSPFEERKSFPAPKIVKVRQSNAPVAPRRREQIAARNKKIVEPEESLTEEEQYAYDQLMLALTITGSKLKIVQDKVNGIEERSAAVNGQ